MKRMIVRAALLVLALSAGSAFAVAKGGTLYIKNKDTKVLKEAKASAATVTTLNSGDEVVWQGADAKDKSFHQIDAKGKKGLVLQVNLSPSKPVNEVVGSDGKPIDPQAFAGSGAATKALSEAGLKYAGDKADATTIAAQIIYVEENSEANRAGKPVEEHIKAAGLSGGKK